MRERRIRPKAKQAVGVPDDLLDFLRDVHEMIETGDESATMESDDLLQCPSAYGGLIEDGGNRYGFTYFPEKGVRNKWELDLDVVDIERIAGGEIAELELWACEAPECRCMFSDPQGICLHCDYVTSGEG